MENLTHSLLGAALAELALPPVVPRGTRRVFLAVGVVASNLPDIDLVYTRITAAPLGYLLHHRGHTHTILGLLVQAALLAGLCWLIPAVRRLDVPVRRRLVALGAIALASHLVLDSWNSYGVHPFHPLDSRWYYGDAVFIFEPWLWMLLGVAGAANAVRRASRILVAAAVTLLPLALASLGVLSTGAFFAVVAAGLAFSWLCRRLAPRTRTLVALGAAGAFVALVFGLGTMARRQVRDLLAAEVRGEVVDVVLSALPAEPVCWTAIAVEKDEGGGRFVLHRGTLSLAPSLVAPQDCALHKLWRLPSIPWAAQARFARDEPTVVPLATLRHYAARDCRVRAWMQFGRAPFFRGDEIRDLRYETGPRENFTTMTILEGGACPAHVTSWGLPRADLLN